MAEKPKILYISTKQHTPNPSICCFKRLNDVRLYRKNKKGVQLGNIEKNTLYRGVHSSGRAQTVIAVYNSGNEIYGSYGQSDKSDTALLFIFFLSFFFFAQIHVHFITKASLATATTFTNPALSLLRKMAFAFCTCLFVRDRGTIGKERIIKYASKMRNKTFFSFLPRKLKVWKKKN